MVKLAGTFNKLGFRKVLVAGDLILDTYTKGKVNRISPEAPVAVINVKNEEHRPGGAGNVILNLISLGTEVVVLGRVGQDFAGETLKQSLTEEYVKVEGIVTQQNFPTPMKNRIIADNQQIVRIDHEKIMPLPEQIEQEIIQQLPLLFQGVSVVAISDYGKGFLSPTLLRALIDLARLQGIPVIADPKGLDFGRYSGATIIKPNLGEAYAAANLPLEAPLEIVAKKILQISQTDVLMITRSEAGISLFYKDGCRQDFPVQVREVKDVTGAGDTVLAMLTCALANNLSIAEAVQLSNIAAGIAIERFGCARITLSDLARRLLDHHVENKIFDEEHVYVLQKALQDRKFILLGLSGEEQWSSHLFTGIRLLARRDEDLLVCVLDGRPEEEFVQILASIQDIDFIVLANQSLRTLCSRVEPSEIYGFKDNTLCKMDDIESITIQCE